MHHYVPLTELKRYGFRELIGVFLFYFKLTLINVRTHFYSGERRGGSSLS